MTVGVSVKRTEDARLLVGAGRYLDDLRVPGLLHLAIVRSPHPHARIVSVERHAARACPGAVAVLTVDDLPELAGSVPPLVPAPAIRSYAHPVLAGPVVRHAGEAVAVAVAEDPYAAADAAERVRVEYEPLPGVYDP
ncbi:MAG: xanthine dehydrogenase family protein molybdopterin-binding subunit, partial [Candidatus Rokuibacteriota bacterium]